MNDLSISEDVIDLYYNAVRSSIEGDYYCIDEFIKRYPQEYKRLSAVHRKRSKINNCLKAMRVLSENIYWGSLTFNDLKDRNKETSKRKEVFNWLNDIFDYFLIIEEYGELNGRYHIHFLGLMKFDKSCSDFMNHWHSREQIRRVDFNKNLSSYLVKYLSKDLPRIRCNKKLVKLVTEYKKGVKFDNLGFKTLGAEIRCQNVNVVTIFDLEV